MSGTAGHLYRMPQVDTRTQCPGRQSSPPLAAQSKPYQPLPQLYFFFFFAFQTRTHKSPHLLANIQSFAALFFRCRVLSLLVAVVGNLKCSRRLSQKLGSHSPIPPAGWSRYSFSHVSLAKSSFPILLNHIFHRFGSRSCFPVLTAYQ